ncbi:transcription elongation factor GreB [Bathymodiolus platifrons methanotrophic gill symbiont]|uniref:transcription elongation factor GreB n=1 Tax=Bathymodiolus platifrons methanotrophic gill symbiont TaxID=113268 RepID=UPI000B422633|nr:transcription elongation factor GreB [Bathymodiolus platifrons methanotrophic gill symbiont]MCK5869350.1 transcription elongation factor GreB [Methyloprofundus sp.]TXK98780.1 transcription elongation factor GreB [Methylococcaceae bacterium CS4]TXK99110.1 transcription elongation factor GreB [Methylococcaceae bacterium CS5]TXL04766.1 transcription elongation factor GreB [Methylococcaceae bacterium CS1]TXL06656.1 transcription elongation factor GreB [Methylococcaceae bacterium CS3]TXL10785.1
MARWKAPRPKSSPYITPAGYQRLENELKGLWHKRKDVVTALSAAAAEGDRSENAEYIYRKKELRGIDSRIHFLQKRMPSLNIISETPADQDRVFFSAWVLLENDKGEGLLYRIVGADEFEMNKCYISLDSPLARALLKKTFDDQVMIRNEFQETRYTVFDIQYGPEFIAS